MNRQQVFSTCKVGGVLLIICLVAALLLASVNLITSPAIAAQKQAKIDDAISNLFPSFDRVETVREGDGKTILNVWSVHQGQSTIGYCVQSAAAGYGGDIVLMIGYTVQGKIIAISVVSHSETKGIGSKVLDEEYLSRYHGLSISGVKRVDGLSGATLTSAGVKAAVSAANQVMMEVVA